MASPSSTLANPEQNEGVDRLEQLVELDAQVVCKPIQIHSLAEVVDELDEPDHRSGPDIRQPRELGWAADSQVGLRV